MLLFLLLACDIEVDPATDGDGDGFTAGDGDCDDADPDANPGAPEVCDGRDDDCDGDVDEADAADARTWYTDADGDGWGADGTGTVACTLEGATDQVGDCDDTRADVNADAFEACDDLDANCNGDLQDGSDATTWYADADADGFGDGQAWLVACDQPDGYVADGQDCDDAAADVSPAGTETCDAEDDDCDGDTDEGAADAPTWYADGDGDGWGDAATTLAVCDAPTGFVAEGTDCDDDDSSRFPGNVELCDGDDEDCDGVADEDDATDAPTWYADTDADGYGDPATAAPACTAPAGRVADATDCDDADAATNPGVPTWTDADGDGFGAGAASDLCTRDGARVDGDCDDAAADVNPAATETCDGTDTNCSGDEDDARDAPTWYGDTDGDGYGGDTTTTRACTMPASYLAAAEDCDDADPAVSPDATEVCNNGVDDDCDDTYNGCALEGTLTGADAWAQVTAGGEITAATVEDLDGDGDRDLVLSGSTTGLQSIDVWWGPLSAGTGASPDVSGSLGSYYLAGAEAGDVDANGVADLLVGSFYDDTGASEAGAAYVFFDGLAGVSAGTPDAVLYGTTPSGYLGGALAVGDTDGDGIDDVLLGMCASPSSTSVDLPLFLGPISGSVAASAADATLARFWSSGAFGTSVLISDGDGDGYGDAFVGDRDNNAVWVLRGPLSGRLTAGSTTDRWYDPAGGISYMSEGDNNALARASDADGDGLDDVLVGGVNTAYLLSGDISGTVTVSASTAIATFGGSWSSALAISADQDLDQDGTADVVLGQRMGGTYVYYGPVSGTYTLTTDGDATVDTDDERGSVGDLDDDGYPDVGLFAYPDGTFSIFRGGGL